MGRTRHADPATVRTRVGPFTSLAALGILLSITVHAQLPVPLALPQLAGPAVDPNLRFEVASIRPHDPSTAVVIMRMLPGGVEAIGVSVRALLLQAFRVRDHQLAGVPDWVNSQRYTINAKAPGAPQSAGPTLLTNLLKDRFQLATHSETRDMPAYALVRARADGRLGASLKPSSKECHATMNAIAAERAAGRYTPPPTALPGTPGGAPLFDPEKPQCGSGRTGPGIAGGGGRAIADLAQTLSQFTGRPVVDRTGLTGLYDFVLKFTPEPGLNPNAPPGAPPISFGGDSPTLFTAVQEQLGLKLESVRAPVDVIVIDRIERPTVD
jgi:uncharacterized protein (TIGR03435 family)